jgi:hypothetical protein
MKSTIKITKQSRLTVSPDKAGEGVQIAIEGIQETVAVLYLTPDMAGALIFALEQACEANEKANQREAV